MGSKKYAKSSRGKLPCQRLPKTSPRVPTRTTAGELAVETVEADDYDLLLLPVRPRRRMSVL